MKENQRKQSSPLCIALITAAGEGKRFDSQIPKQYLNFNGKPILRHCVETFLKHPKVDMVQVIIHPSHQKLYRQAVKGLDLPDPVFGDDSRQASVFNGLKNLESYHPKYVLIHDAARPGVSTPVINRVLESLKTHDGALPGLKLVDSLKRTSSDKGSGTITSVDRKNLWRVQTPQGFDFEKILAAHKQYSGMECSDDAGIAQKAGMILAMTRGTQTNMKITHTEDIQNLERLFMTNMTPHTGFGFDVHSFCEGDHVILGGIKIPHTHKLKGHSDADVLLHALTDALLGTVGCGDIGEHFPPSDATFKDMDSSIFLKHALKCVQDKQGILTHVDVTVIGEKPKLTPYKQEIRQNIAMLLDLDIENVNVKATTTEKLGFTGRKEGLAAQAVATVLRPRKGS